jgi:hypothetical protein
MPDQLAASETTTTLFECTGCGRRWVDAPGEHDRWLCRGTVHERTFVDLAALDPDELVQRFETEGRSLRPATRAFLVGFAGWLRSVGGDDA